MDPQPIKIPRYESLDLWRGVACLMVLVYHSVFYQPSNSAPTLLGGLNTLLAGVAARMWTGVPVFFVISGYCIAAAVDRRRRTAAGLSGYFFGRFRRIFPPYWIVLVVAAVLDGASDLALSGHLSRAGLTRPWWYSGWQWAGSLTLTEQWRWLFVGGPRALIMGHAWTLCYEEQFYALMGLLLLVCPTRLFLGALLVTLAVAGAALSAAHFHVALNGLFLDGGWVQFAFGVLVYAAVAHGRPRGRVLASAALVLLAVAAPMFASALEGAPRLGPEPQNMASATPYVVAAIFALLALLLHPFDSPLVRLRILTPIRRCGEMCYSLYLIHLPVVALLAAAARASGADLVRWSPLVTVACFGPPAIWVSWRFHKTVELRFIR